MTTRFVIGKVSGGSMLPLLPTGTRILIDETPLECVPVRGTIVVIRASGERFLLHRLIGSTRDGKLITRGDNTTSEDEPFRPEELKGRLAGWQDSCGRWVAPNSRAESIKGALLSFGARRLLKLLHFPLTLLCPCRPLEFASDQNAMRNSPGNKAQQTGFETQELGDEFIIHDRQSGDVHVLNEVAAQIWKRAQLGDKESDILEVLKREYPETDPRQLTADLQRTVRELSGAGLLPQKQSH